MCGRERGGKNVAEFGVCPAAADRTFDGINSGKCGGRICWAVAGTFCGGCVQGSFADKRPSCLNCDFYEMVQDEEGVANRRTKFLQFIFEENRSPFFDKMTYRRVKAGERFVVQDAVEDTAYIIQRGACLVIVEKDGELHPVNHYGEGDIVGGLGILTGEPRRAHVEAETDMDLWVMTRDQFDEMTEKDPALLDFITELVADRLDSRRPTAYRTIGKYVATDIIGRGAFSIVYKGRHTGLNMPVAIKMMRHDMALYPDFIDSFHNEAKIIAGLIHDHIVRIHDIEERYRTLFIIMEYLKGDSLTCMIEHLRAIPPKLAASFLIQVCSALAYAHKRGIIHRDINPSNIIVQPHDHIKILDFGLACSLGTEDFSNAGTAQYMAPEQIEGRPVDERTDIYALGITAYEMVTGRRPFPEENAKALLDMHLAQDAIDPADIDPDIPAELRRFILKSVRCDPDRRYQDMEQAMTDLKPLVQDNRLTRNSLTTEEKKTSSLFLTYADDNQPAFRQLVEVFSAKARDLGVDIKVTDHHDSWVNSAINKKIEAEDGAIRLTIENTEFFGITHIGFVREVNEDRYLIKELEDKSILIAIADGLGGEAAGEYAAEILRRKLADLNHISRNNEQHELEHLASVIDRAIYGEGQKNPALEGMSSTLVGVLLRDRIAYWVHVGDSRLYLLRNGILSQVTEDQTLGRFLLEEGEITAEQLPNHYSRHVMDQCVGCGYVEPESGRFKSRAGDLLMLSTDGLHREIPVNTMHSILNADTHLETKARALVNAALDAGGKDNITVVMAQG